MIKRLLAVLVLCASCAAATESCPVRIDNVNAGVLRGVYGQQRYREHFLKVKWTNDSAKTVTGVKFHVTYLDSVGDLHEDEVDKTTDAKEKPGKSHTDLWNNEYFAQNYNAAEVSVVKVAFEDGSTWAPEQASQCVTRGH